MIDTHILREVTILHDLGSTNQIAKAMVCDIENSMFLEDSSFLSDIIGEASELITTRQEDTVYVVIKITSGDD